MSTQTVLLFRDGFFYPVTYPKSYKNWQAEAERNPGTQKIMDARAKKVLWSAPVN